MVPSDMTGLKSPKIARKAALEQKIDGQKCQLAAKSGYGMERRGHSLRAATMTLTRDGAAV